MTSPGCPGEVFAYPAPIFAVTHRIAKRLGGAGNGTETDRSGGVGCAAGGGRACAGAGGIPGGGDRADRAGRLHPAAFAAGRDQNAAGGAAAGGAAGCAGSGREALGAGADHCAGGRGGAGGLLRPGRAGHPERHPHRRGLHRHPAAGADTDTLRVCGAADRLWPGGAGIGDPTGGTGGAGDGGGAASGTAGAGGEFWPAERGAGTAAHGGSGL